MGKKNLLKSLNNICSGGIDKPLPSFGLGKTKQNISLFGNSRRMADTLEQVKVAVTLNRRYHVRCKS